MPEKIQPHASPSEKTLSLYSLLLFSGKKYSLSQLAEILRCSKQTVLRMIEQIEMSHSAIVVSWIEGGRKWFKVKTPERRPQICLKPEDIQHLLLCRDFVWHLLPQVFREEISTTIAKTTVLLPDMEERDLALTELGQVRVKGFIDYDQYRQQIATLLRAIANHLVCKVVYQSPWREEPTIYCIAPLSIIAHQGALYIRCWLVTFKGEPEIIYDNMLMAVHRVLEAEATERTFAVSDDALPHMEQTFGLMQDDSFRVKVSFKTDAAVYIKERQWSKDQIISDTSDGGVILEFTATSWPEVISWVLSFGPEAMVIEPEDLREEIKEAARKLIKKYE